MQTEMQPGNSPANGNPDRLPSSKSLAALVLDLVKPYYKWLLIIFMAMLAETAMSLAAPWPLKVIIDNVISDHRLPQWMAGIRDLSIGEDKMNLAALAAVAMIVFTALGGWPATSIPISPKAWLNMWPTICGGACTTICCVFPLLTTTATRWAGCLVRSLRMYPPSRTLPPKHC
jgi:ABC-type multidrug transport system fused ATPase/permease subunit